MSILPFDTAEELIVRANDTNFGLAAAVRTRDIKKALHVPNNIRTGTMWINCYNVMDTTIAFRRV